MNALCPYCLIRSDEALQVNEGDSSPAPGDVMLCFYCGSVGIFTEDSPRKPTYAELSEFLANPDVVRGLMAIREIHEKGARP